MVTTSVGTEGSRSFTIWLPVTQPPARPSASTSTTARIAGIIRGVMAKRQLKMLAPLSAEEFRHPRDAKATDALKRLPGLDTLLSKIME